MKPLRDEPKDSTVTWLLVVHRIVDGCNILLQYVAIVAGIRIFMILMLSTAGSPVDSVCSRSLVVVVYPNRTFASVNSGAIWPLSKSTGPVCYRRHLGPDGNQSAVRLG